MLNILRYVSLATLVVAIAACTSTVPVTQQVEAAAGITKLDPLTDFYNMAEPDLRMAYASAVANEDTLAMRCWASRLEHVKQMPRQALEIIGPASAYQSARNTGRAIDRGLSSEILLACAPMLIDSALRVRRIAGRIIPLLPF